MPPRLAIGEHAAGARENARVFRRAEIDAAGSKDPAPGASPVVGLAENVRFISIKLVRFWCDVLPPDLPAWEEVANRFIDPPLN